MGMPIGYGAGLISQAEYHKLLRKREMIESEISNLQSSRPQFTEQISFRTRGTYLETASSVQSMAQLLRRQEARYHELMNIFELQPVDDDIAEEVELQIKYEGYIQRQVRQVEKFKKLEKKLIPTSFDYDMVSGFSHEVREKFNRVRPETVGQASRISGVTPAAISLLLVAIEKGRRQSHYYNDQLHENSQ